MRIRRIEKEREAAIRLVWEVFLQYEAPVYPQEGINSFRNFLDDRETMDTLEFFGAFCGGQLRGVLAASEHCNHICLLFVDARYHRQGIGKSLWHHMRERGTGRCVTVNASPYAVPFYHEMGFCDTDAQQCRDGIRYTPMRYERWSVNPGQKAL